MNNMLAIASKYVMTSKVISRENARFLLSMSIIAGGYKLINKAIEKGYHVNLSVNAEEKNVCLSLDPECVAK